MPFRADLESALLVAPASDARARVLGDSPEVVVVRLLLTGGRPLTGRMEFAGWLGSGGRRGVAPHRVHFVGDFAAAIGWCCTCSARCGCRF